MVSTSCSNATRNTPIGQTRITQSVLSIGCQAFGTAVVIAGLESAN